MLHRHPRAGHAGAGPACRGYRYHEWPDVLVGVECGTTNMRIDLILESSESPERIAELSKLAEDNGLGGVWVSNTLNGRDGFTLRTASAENGNIAAVAE